MDKRSFKILVVDDEPDVLEVLARALPKKLFVEVHTANDGDRAIEMAKALKPDFILLDIHMPGHMGWDVLREIRDFDVNVKIVISTDIFVVPPEDESYILQHISGYLTKPSSPDDIVHKIIDVLGPEVAR
jgi:CheY-like chemotaxis protein